MPELVKTILAFDTATGPVSVAVQRGGALLSYREHTTPGSQSACLIPMVEQALNEAGLWYGDLDAIACTTGPGSFTGIRVGLAAARAVALGADIPAIGISTLATMAYGARTRALAENRPVFSVLNAGKGEAYAQAFGFSPRFSALETAALLPLAATASRWPDAIVLSNEHDAHFPSARWLAEIAMLRESKEESALTPFYIRPPDAKIPVL